MISVNIVCAFFLILSSVFGVVASIGIANKIGRFLNIGTLIILNYVIVQQVSGIVHLTGLNSKYRGFYDLWMHDPQVTIDATISSVVGLVAISIPCIYYASKIKAKGRRVAVSGVGGDSWMTHKEFLLAAAVVLLILPLSVFSLIKISTFAASFGSVRVVSIDGGMARYSFLSNWFVWAVSLCALLLLGRRSACSPVVTAIVAAVSVVLISASLMWTGGRSIIIVMVLPLLMILLPRFGRLKAPMAVLGLLSAISYVAYTSYNRQIGSSRQSVEVWTWLDWEWGRFSIFGSSAEYVRQQGFANGETIVYGFQSALFGILRFFGINVGTDAMSVASTTSRIVLGDFDSTYIVPGITSEFYLNFGFLGVLVGCLILGSSAGLIDLWISRSKSILTRMFLLYCGAVLIFRVIPAESGALYYYIFYAGLPLIVCSLLTSFFGWGAGYKGRNARASG